MLFGSHDDAILAEEPHGDPIQTLVVGYTGRMIPAHNKSVSSDQNRNFVKPTDPSDPPKETHYR